MGRRGRRHRVLEPGRVAAARGRHPRGRAAALRVARAPRRRVCAPPPVFPRRGRTMFRILDDLIRVGETGLRELWLRGSAPATEELVGWVFRGWNTARIAARTPVGGRAFAKGFFRDGAGVAGCNFVVRVRAGEWHIDTGRPFGFFAVTPAADWRRRRAALLLDYGRGRERERLAAGGVRPGRQSLALSRSEEHTSELQSLRQLVCRLLLEKKKQEFSIDMS